jgi:hypothetical protein
MLISCVWMAMMLKSKHAWISPLSSVANIYILLFHLNNYISTLFVFLIIRNSFLLNQTACTKRDFCTHIFSSPLISMGHCLVFYKNIPIKHTKSCRNAYTYAHINLMSARKQLKHREW